MQKEYNFGDTIIFKVDGEEYTYRITSSYLSAVGYSNNIIFEKLKIGDRYKFCNKVYGYENLGGDFPEYRCGDKENMNAIVHELMSLCDGGSTVKSFKEVVEYKKEKGVCVITGEVDTLLKRKGYKTFENVNISEKGFKLLEKRSIKKPRFPESLEGRTGGHIKSKRTFGMEIECFSTSTISSSIVNSLIDDRYENHEDGSVNGSGDEYVSPILKGLKGEVSLTKTLDLLYNAGYRVDDSCGSHVHIGIPEAKDRVINKRIDSKLKDLLLFYTVFDPAIALLLPKYRRHNSFCRPLDYEVKESDLKDLKEKDFLKYWYKSENDDQVNDRKDRKEYRTRYLGINFNSITYRGTLEIRYHQGTLSPDHIIPWIDLHAGIIDYVLDGNITEDEIEELRKIKDPKDLLNKLLILIKEYINEGTPRIMKDRIKEVDDKDTEYEEAYSDYNEEDSDDDCDLYGDEDDDY